MCSYYKVWRHMLQRCYDKKYQIKNHTYLNCTVCDEWLTFSSFKAWMEKQEWKGKELDKDLLNLGNRQYSPDSCIFLDKRVNSFLLDCAKARGEHKIGVSFCKASRKFRSQCRNPFTKKEEYLGLFTSEELAHSAWKSRKHEIACQLAETQRDERVAAALRSRYI